MEHLGTFISYFFPCVGDTYQIFQLLMKFRLIIIKKAKGIVRTANLRKLFSLKHLLSTCIKQLLSFMSGGYFHCFYFPQCWSSKPFFYPLKEDFLTLFDYLPEDFKKAWCKGSVTFLPKFTWVNISLYILMNFK